MTLKKTAAGPKTEKLYIAYGWNGCCLVVADFCSSKEKAIQNFVDIYNISTSDLLGVIEIEYPVLKTCDFSSVPVTKIKVK